jgi:hypothetical protein
MMKPTPKVFASRLAPEHFAARPVAAAATLILAMTAQALPLSYLIELERAKIEPATKLFQQVCGGGHADSQACKEQRDALVKALNGFVSIAQKELALLDANAGDADLQKQTAAARRTRMQQDLQSAQEQLKSVAQ